MKNRKILLLILYLPVLLLLPSTAKAQGINISSGVSITFTGTAFLEITNGDFVNNGTYAKGTETVIFSGNTANTITGNNTDMYNLSITNTGGITTRVGLLATNNLTVASGSKLTIDPAKAVTVSGTLTNNTGTEGLIIKSDAAGTASLIHHTDNVPATVERYISGDAEAWHFLSSPVAAQSISGIWTPSGSYGNGTGYDLYLWNEPNNCWIYKLDATSTINWNTVHSDTAFVVGRGYLYSVQATNPTKEFVGTINNGTISYGLTFSSTDANLKGFNLVGNPYPSSIDWQATLGWTRSNLVSSGNGYDMWIWNPTANNYGVFNSATGSGTNFVTGNIAPMQGYFVRAAGAGNLSLDNTVRIHDSAGSWRKAEINPDMLSLFVQSATDNSFDESRLLFGYASNQSGTIKLFSHVVTAPSLFIASGGEYYSVRYLTDTVDNPMVPVMFKPGQDGDYTLRCNFDFNKFETVMLEDRQTHSIQNMKIEQAYSFKALKTDDADRFILYFGPVINNSDKEFPATIYSDGIRLIVDLTLISKETDIFVYDLMGQILLQQKLQGEIKHYLNFNAKVQILIVYLKNSNGSLCQKLLWKGN